VFFTTSFYLLWKRRTYFYAIINIFGESVGVGVGGWVLHSFLTPTPSFVDDDNSINVTNGAIVTVLYVDRGASTSED